MNFIKGKDIPISLSHTLTLLIVLLDVSSPHTVHSSAAEDSIHLITNLSYPIIIHHHPIHIIILERDRENESTFCFKTSLSSLYDSEETGIPIRRM